MQTAPHRLGAIALARVAVPRPAAGQPPAPPATQQPAQPAPQAAAPAPTRWRKAEPKVEPPRQPAPAPAPPAQAAPQAPVAKPAAPPPTPAKPPPPAPAKPPPPAPAKPAAAPAQAKPATPPKPAKPGDLSDERMRQLYSSYVEAKRARKESTAGITYESLSKTLRDSSDKLREKHGRSVDFEVTVKDGKTILKPIIR